MLRLCLILGLFGGIATLMDLSGLIGMLCFPTPERLSPTAISDQLAMKNGKYGHIRLDIGPSMIKKGFRGFVPQQYAHPQNLCAYYHCIHTRIDNRRYCKLHADQYDLEALEGDNKILPWLDLLENT